MKNRNKGIVLSYLHTAVNMVCGLVLSVFLLRALGDTEYGIYQTIASFANCLVLLEFGMGTVIMRNISMCRGREAGPEELQRNISTIWTLTWLLCGIIAAVSVLFYLLIPTIYANSMSIEQTAYAQQIFVFITGYLIVAFLLQTLNGVILAYEHYAYAPILTTVRTLARMVLLLTLLTQYRYAILIAVVDMLVNGACLAVSYGFCKKKLSVKLLPGVCDRAILRSALPLCLAIFLQAIVNQVSQNAAKFLIGITMSPESVTLYSVALYIFSIFASLTTIPVSMYAPAVTRKVGEGLWGKQLAGEVIVPCRLTALVGGMVLFGFAAVGRQFVDLLYGRAYLQAWYIAIILMAPVYINMVNGVLVNVLDALNKRMSRSVVLIMSTGLNIVLTIFWLDRWGLMGAAVAMALTTFLGQVLIMNVYYQKVLQIPVLWLFRQAFRGIWLYLVLGCVVALAVGQMISGQFISFLVSGCLFVVIALGGYMCFGMTESEKQLLRKIVNRGVQRGR
jgi:O-antigen/teichoic acid export membrane protein